MIYRVMETHYKYISSHISKLHKLLLYLFLCHGLAKLSLLIFMLWSFWMEQFNEIKISSPNNQNKQIIVEPESSKVSPFELLCSALAKLVTNNSSASSIQSRQPTESGKNGFILEEHDSLPNVFESPKTFCLMPKLASTIHSKQKEVKVQVAEEDSNSADLLSCGVNISLKDNGGSHSLTHGKVSSKTCKAAEGEIQDYCSSHKILLVGEGDFSFSACLAKAFGSATNMVATSLNSEVYLQCFYKDAMNNISELRTRGCNVLHGVDATDVSNHKSITGLSFDLIIYNFPHCGDFSGTTDALRKNQNLVREFMKNSAKLIKEDGEIHIRHKSNYFFRLWDLEQLASEAGLVLMDEAPFDASMFRGYNTKYGFEGARFGSDYNFDCCPSCTYKFVLPK